MATVVAGRLATGRAAGDAAGEAAGDCACAAAGTAASASTGAAASASAGVAASCSERGASRADGRLWTDLEADREIGTEFGLARADQSMHGAFGAAFIGRGLEGLDLQGIEIELDLFHQCSPWLVGVGFAILVA